MYDYEEMWYEKYIEEKKKNEELEKKLAEAQRLAEHYRDKSHHPLGESYVSCIRDDECAPMDIKGKPKLPWEG